MATSILKTKIIDKSLGTVPTKWDTYQRNAAGQYVFLASGTGTGRKRGIDLLTRSWWTYGGTGSWKTFRAANGYLPTQNMTESHDFVRQCDNISTYFCYGGSYRVNMKTVDPVYVPALSGLSYFAPVFLTKGVEDAGIMLDAKHKALSEARDMKVHLPVMFGEGRETVRLLADSVRRLGKAYRFFQTGRFRRAAKELNLPFDYLTRRSKTAASHWLEYSLGWMPLLADAKGLLELAEKGLLNPDRGPRFSVRGKSQTTHTWTTTTVGQGASNLPGGETKLTGQTVAVGRAGLLLEYKAGATGLNSVGLGTFDPISAAWEFIPFSFVFDYFIDVGSYLESLSSLQDVSVLAGFESSMQLAFGRAVMNKPETSGWIDGMKPYADFTWRLYRRKSWTGSVSLRSPLWDGLNARRITTMAALWRQLCGGDRVPGKYRP